MLMKQKIFRLIKWLVNIIFVINLFFLLTKVPFYQNKMKVFDNMEANCKGVDLSLDQRDKCLANYSDESSKYINAIRSNAVWGIYLPIIFYGAIYLYRDFFSA